MQTVTNTRTRPLPPLYNRSSEPVLIMTSNHGEGDQMILNLHHIIIETPIKVEYRVKLSIDGSDVQLTREKQSPVWAPSRTREVSESSKLKVALKTGHQFAGISLGREESAIEIDIQEALQQFLDTMEHEVTISGKTVFRKQPVTIVVSLRLPPTSESVLSELQKLQAEMLKFRQIMGNSTQQHLDTVIKCGTAISQLDPRAQLAFSILTVTFDLLKDQQKRDQSVSELAAQLKRIFPFASKSLEETIDDNADILRRTIGRLYTLAIDVAAFTYEYIKQNRFKRLTKSIVSAQNAQRIGELTGDFETVVKDFERAIDVETLKTIRSLEETILLSRLQPLDTGYSLDRRCMEETRVALLDEIVEWAIRPRSVDSLNEKTSASINIYWLYGIPGVGKTAMANSICARLHKEGRLAGGFFCRRDDPKLSDPKYVLPTLVCKLAESWGPYRKLVADKLRKDPLLNQNSAGSELFSQLLESLRNHSRPQPPHPLVLVIDAFDECGDVQGRRSILASLLGATSQVDWLRIVITSRQEQDIDAFFKRPDCVGRYLSGDLEKDRNTVEDIRLFAQRKFSLVAEQCGLADDWPGEKRLEQVVLRSRGLFIFVETLWRSLQEELDQNQYLDQALSGESGDPLVGLYRLYSTTISSRVGKNQNAFRSVMAVVVAVAQYQALSDKSVAQLAGLAPELVTTLVNKLSSLLYRDATENGGIRVRHLSIIDFLTKTNNSPHELKIDLQQAHCEVGVACLNTMTQELKFNICDLESSFTPNRDVTDLDTRIKQKISTTLLYSCLYWSEHLSYTPDTQNQIVYTALDSFTLDPRLLYWVEVLSLLAKVRVGESAMRRMLSWFKPSDSPLIRRISDTLRFLLIFHEPIVTSTPHMYLSGLPFIPTNADLWKGVSTSFQNMVRVQQGRMKDWPTLPDLLRGHSYSVNTVTYSPDGRYIASGSDDETIRIWDTETGAGVGEPLKGHTYAIQSVAFSPDGRHIASGSLDSTVSIWDTETGAAVIERLKGHTKAVNSVAYSPDGRRIISGSYDHTILIWEAEKGTTIGEPLIGHTDTVTSVVYSPDGRYIASGSADKTIRIWEAETGGMVAGPLKGHTNEVLSLAYSPDGQYIVSGSKDWTICIWDAARGVVVGKPLEGHESTVTSVAYSPDGRYISSGSWDQTVRIWDAETGVAIRTPLERHTDWVNSVAYSPDGRFIVSGSADTTICIFDAKTGAVVGKPSEGHTDGIMSAAYSPDGRCIVSSSIDKTVRIWNAQTGDSVGKPLEGHIDTITSVTYSPDGRFIASGSSDKTIRTWNAETGDPVGEPLEHDSWVAGVSYSPNSAHIAFVSGDKTVRIWDAANRVAITKPLEGHSNYVTAATYSHDGRYIFSASHDRTICIWDAATGVMVGRPLKGHTSEFTSIASSPDGRHIISGSFDNTIRIWDVEKDAPSKEPLEGHTGPVSAVAYSPDGRHIVSGSWDHTIRIWNADTGALIGGPLTGHTGGINSVAYSPDGQFIMSSSSDRTIRIWDTANLENTISRDLKPDSNGWIHRPGGGLWFWVPEDYRNGLTCPAILTIPTSHPHRVVCIDTSGFSFGSSWNDIKVSDS